MKYYRSVFLKTIIPFVIVCLVFITYILVINQYFLFNPITLPSSIRQLSSAYTFDSFVKPASSYMHKYGMDSEDYFYPENRKNDDIYAKKMLILYAKVLDNGTLYNAYEENPYDLIGEVSPLRNEPYDTDIPSYITEDPGYKVIPDYVLKSSYPLYAEGEWYRIFVDGGRRNLLPDFFINKNDRFVYVYNNQYVEISSDLHQEIIQFVEETYTIAANEG